jgi:hypothetical protein
MRLVPQAPRRADGFLTRLIGDEMVIVPVRSGVANLEALFTMNPVGAAIWGRIDGQATPQDLADGLADEFAVTPAEALADVNEFLALLAAKGLLAADRGAP